MASFLQQFKFVLSLITPAVNNICIAQTTAGAANLTITGSLASGGVVSLTTAHKLDIDSAADLSGVQVTITGTDANNVAQIETITGPNATTVASVYYFKTITQVAVDGAVGTNVSVGTSDEAATKDVLLAYKASTGFLVGLAVSLTGTINYTVQHTFNNVIVDTSDGSVYFDHSSLASNTANAEGAYSTPVYNTRLVVNSFTAGATIIFYVIKA